MVSLVLFATQVATNLAGASTLRAAALDAARTVASGTVDHSDPSSVARAEVRALRDLEAATRSGIDIRDVRWQVSREIVRLSVSATPRRRWKSIVAVGLDHLDQSVSLRIETAP